MLHRGPLNWVEIVLIIPLEKSIDWRRPPIVTLLMVLINFVVLFGVQSGDDEQIERAYDYYQHSRLPHLEFPRYLEDLELRDEFEEADEWRRHLQDGDLQGSDALLAVMQGDDDFMHRLRAHEVITPADPKFRHWRAARREFEALLRKSATYSYGFVPDEHHPLTMFTHMFMHGGFGHLFGNMLFLVLVGFALEAALGSLVYLSLYLVGGIGGVLLFWAAYPHSALPLVGASGAIAALMGLYAILFGRRRIRFFYSVLFYFDYVKAPAIALFPVWVANEVYQLTWGEMSNVAYVAHIGGLLTGALLGLAVSRIPGRVDTEYLDASERDEERVRRYEQGLEKIKLLEVDRAKSIFRALHRDYPDDREVLMQWYKTEKLGSTTDEFHHAARKILSLTGSDSVTLARVHETFDDYLKASGGRVRLNPASLVTLSVRFSKGGYVETAERILTTLLRAGKPVTGLDSALLALATAWDRAGDAEKSRQFHAELERRFPGIAASTAHVLMSR